MSNHTFAIAALACCDVLVLSEGEDAPKPAAVEPKRD